MDTNTWLQQQQTPGQSGAGGSEGPSGGSLGEQIDQALGEFDDKLAQLRDTLEDARSKGAEVINLVPDCDFNDEYRKIPPHLVLNPTEEMTIMQEEIFGPLLPVKTYKDLDEVISYIGERDRPLGL